MSYSNKIIVMQSKPLFIQKPLFSFANRTEDVGGNLLDPKSAIWEGLKIVTSLEFYLRVMLRSLISISIFEY